MKGSLTPGMQRWLDEDVNDAHRRWREYLNGVASYEREVLADPEAWAPVILADLRQRRQRLRAQLLDKYGVDPDSGDQPGEGCTRPRNLAELEAFLKTVLGYETCRSTLQEIETNVARLSEDRHAIEVCECWFASSYAVPAMSTILVETLAELYGTRSAEQAASEVIAASLAGYFACRISLNRSVRLKWLLILERGSPFQNLLRHLPLEALGVWADADPLRQRMDDLARQAKKAVEDHLKRERVKSGGIEVADRPDEDADDDLATFETRETARAEAARYTAARERAGLSPQERKVGDLREAGLSYKEIAARVGIAQSTVGVVLSRYREKVLRQLS